MATKICSFREVPGKMSLVPTYTDPTDSTSAWKFIGLVEGLSYFSYDDEKVSIGTDDSDYQFKIYDFDSEDDTNAIKSVVKSFSEVKGRIDQLEVEYMQDNNAFSAMKAFADSGGDFAQALSDLEDSKNEYLQSLGFPGTGILI